MSKIAPLSDETINLIAAGEVIEAPACAVKELVENALDAGAQKIIIEIVDGGLGKIAIHDDGEGMSATDARLSIVRHATSKLTHAKDLLKTMTMGFRGEALAAIAAISEMRIETQMATEKLGTALTVEKGEIIEESPISRPVGTSIEVHALFANSPVRRSFQPSAKACTNLVRRMIEAQALGNPKIAFTLIADDRPLAIFPAPSVEWGQEVLRRRFMDVSAESELLSIEVENSEGRVWGYVGAPHLAQKNRRGAWLFINGRSVKPKPIEELVKRGLSTSISEDCSPIFCLHVKLPLEQVDINIHPKKMEVDFHMPKALARLLSQEITRSLARKPETSNHELPKNQPAPFFDFAKDKPTEKEKETLEPIDLFKKPLIVVHTQIGAHFILSTEPVEEPPQLWICHGPRFVEAYFFSEIQKEKIESTRLTTPLSFPLTPSEMDWIEDEIFEEMGFVLRPGGPSTLLVEALPKCCSFCAAEDIIRESLCCLMAKGSKEKLERATFIEKIAKRIRRRGALAPSKSEMEVFLEKVFACPAVLQTPLYRRAVSNLDEKKLDQLFL